MLYLELGFPGGSEIKVSACICLQCGRPDFDPWVRNIPWRRKWQPTPVFLPGECHGRKSLVGYSPWGRKESDMNLGTFLVVQWLGLCASPTEGVSLIPDQKTQISHVVWSKDKQKQKKKKCSKDCKTIVSSVTKQSLCTPNSGVG